jgi:hypothetical protein
MPVAEIENRSRPVAARAPRRIATLASHIYAGTCRWLELVAELDRRGAWAEWGCGSCAEWLAWRCALTPRAAREHVRVARALRELPAITAAFACGELSYAKVRALTRIATPLAEEELLELARDLTAAQLERAVAGYRYVTAREADDLHAFAQLGWSWAEEGSLIVRGRLAPEQGALFVRALEGARDALRDHGSEKDTAAAGDTGDGSAEPRPSPRRPTNAEALAAMAERSLSSGAERSGAERYQVVVHVDRSTLAEDEPGTCRLEDGPALAAETVRRVACDASLVTIEEQDGEPLSLGRKKRAVPSALRRALQVRDRGCRFPGCENRRFLDAHHIHHWAAAARRGSTTSSSSVAGTTDSCTRAATGSGGSRTASSSSATRGAGPSPTCRGRRPATSTTCSPRTTRSTSRRGRARAATVTGWTSTRP